MAENADEFSRLIESVRAGSETAIRELIDRYSYHIYREIRLRLNPRMRTMFDSQDFSQAVWASFFSNRRKIADFENPESLIAFLGAMASHKVIDECRRRLQTQRHNINRRRSIESSFIRRNPLVAAQISTPSETAIRTDELDKLLENHPPYYRTILELRSVGATYHEIGANLGMHENSVRRVVNKLYRQFAEQ